MLKANLFDIQRYSIHDGSGIRTLVFFKGCPLKCDWCCNPESQFALPEMAYFPDNCIRCDKCIPACPYGAIKEVNNILITDRTFCRECYHSENPLQCTEVCPSLARKAIGKSYTLDEVMKEVLKDEFLFKQTGGGVTLSGGEPTSQAEFARELLKELQDNWINTAIETCGFCKWEDLESLLPYLDEMFIDFKIYDSVEHEKYTGVKNDLILNNLRNLGAVLDNYKINIVVRTPVIPGITDSKDNIENICRFLSEVGLKNIEFLKYHKLGRGKYLSIGKEYKHPDIEPPTDEFIAICDDIARNYGLNPIHFE